MSRDAQRPTRSDAGPTYDYKESHPAYAVIGASRVSSTPGHSLFGSDFLHRNYIVIRIGHAEMTRGLATDWVHGSSRMPILELALSESQWATFLSTLNVGDGVPATLSFAEGAEVPGIIPVDNRREQFNDEVVEHLRDSIALMKDVLAAAPTKALREKATRAIQQMEANLPFVTEQFDEHAEKTVEKAKSEVAAYVDGAIRRAGLQALGGGPVLEIAAGVTEE